MPEDRWASGSTYEAFMGRWSRQLAPRFVSWLGIPAGTHWLDVGCGTGALAGAIAAHAGPASVVGCDPSEAFIQHARTLCSDDRVTFVHAGAGALPRRAGGYGSVSSLLALNFLPDAGRAVEEMRSLVPPQGVVSACVWDYGEGMEFLRVFWDAAIAVDPAARELDEGPRFPICRPASLTMLFGGGGLERVRCEPIEIATRFTDFEDYWRPFLGGTGTAPTYVSSLDEDHRVALARTLEDTLPRAADGSITLVARAWAVRGTA
jgi:SAM-dependent methyltransferase